MAFNEFEDRGRAHLLGGREGDTVEAHVMGPCLSIDSNGSALFNRSCEEDVRNVRAFANALLRWCETGSL